MDNVIKSEAPSSTATAAMPSGMPMPRFTRLPGRSSRAARREMIFRSSNSMGAMPESRMRISPL